MLGIKAVHYIKEKSSYKIHDIDEVISGNLVKIPKVTNLSYEVVNYYLWNRFGK